jgi:purine-binding chemotaxis protein CheW
MAADAAEPEGATDGATVQVVEFLVGGERYAVDVGDVDSIEELRGMTRVPRTNDAVAGVMDLRGEITAILDPAVHLAVEPGERAAEEQVLVLDQSVDKQKLGLQVDAVVGVNEYPERFVVPHEDFDELDTAGVNSRVLEALIRRESDESEFEPVGWFDAEALVEESRRLGRPTDRAADPEHDEV